MGNKRTTWYVTASVVLMSLVLAYIGFHLPVSETATRPLADQWRMALAMILATFWFAAAVEFLISVKVFKPALRLAYRLFAVAMILISFSYMQFPVYGMLNWWGSWWVNGGGAMLPFIVGAALMYAGMRKLGLLLKLTGFLLSFKKVAGLSLLITLVVYAFAYNFALPELEGTPEYIAVVACVGAFVFFTFMTTRKIADHIGQEYKSAMRRLEVALFVVLLACVQDVTTSHFVSYGYDFIDFGIFMWPFILGGFMLFMAAQAFSRVGFYAAVPEEAVADKKSLEDKDYLDSITSIASLASRPEDIDPVLDELRKITATLDPGEALTPDDKKHLLGVYKQVETYLMSDDPLRSYSQDELRSRSRPAFQELLVD